MERIISLDGAWRLYYYDATDGERTESEILQTAESIPATVPGNVELDLAAAGVIPADLFRGMATQNNEKWETYDFLYTRTLTSPAHGENERTVLRFEAVDCIAEYYLNGSMLSHSENAFIPHELDITDALLPAGCENRLSVCIRSALLAHCRSEQELCHYYAWKENHPVNQITLRKPAHAFGWDIFPRAATAGIWRSATLRICDGYALKDLSYLYTARGGVHELYFFCAVCAPMRELLGGNLRVEIKGSCGESGFSAVIPIKGMRHGCVKLTLTDPKLWWPYGYGEPCVYDTDFKLLLCDRVLDERHLTVGLRTVELDRSDFLTEPHPRFRFLVNGVEIMCRGSNWVPLDAYHSRDRERYAPALALASDIGCNILRIWGGGVYEEEAFYEYCDRHGIMVWQDFMMACRLYPYAGETYENMRREFTEVIKSLRHHPSLVLWSGDNEVDETMAMNALLPDENRITRELIPSLLARHDPSRPYLPSSPYLPGKIALEHPKNDIYPERHLWGARDYYKASFYRDSKACFVSESGYHGCPSPASVARIVDEGYEFPIYNEQWTLHSSDQQGKDARVHLMEDQIRQLFAFTPSSLEDFSLASQISQAEAMKYFVERIRIARPYTSGIIWWNLLDGWPQMSDAVVDYFFEKKLAYHYLKRAQAPFALMLGEMEKWHYPLYAANDTLTEKEGTYRITDLKTGGLVQEGSFTVGKNRTEQIGKLRMLYSEQTMLLISWTVGGETAYNHYLAGYPAFDFSSYKTWLSKMQTIVDKNER